MKCIQIFSHISHVLVHKSNLQSDEILRLFYEVFSPGERWCINSFVSRAHPGVQTRRNGLRSVCCGSCVTVISRTSFSQTLNPPSLLRVGLKAASGHVASALKYLSSGRASLSDHLRVCDCSRSWLHKRCTHPLSAFLNCVFPVVTFVFETRIYSR